MRTSALSIVVLSALALLPSAAQAAAPRTVASCDGARVDKAAGVARTLSECGRVDMTGGAERAARRAVGRFAGALGVRRDTRDLRLLRVAPTSEGPRVRFQQFVNGVPVRNGQVAVALAEDGSVSHVANSATATSELDTHARVSRTTALLTARRRVPSGFDLVSAPTTTLVAEPTARGGLVLAWLVILPTRGPGDWNVVVSARSGAVLTAYNPIKHVDGSALTYAPNPVQQTGNTSLRDNGDSNQAILNSDRISVPLTDLSPGTNRLVGTYADTTQSDLTHCDRVPPYAPGQASSATRGYAFNRSQDPFEETVAYAAITRVQHSYIDFGFPGIFNHPVAIDVHCDTDDNSFYSPDDGRLHMGDGGVDDAEDADVVVHEFGHATQDAQVPGFAPPAADPMAPTEQGAIGEGFGDFLATYTYLQDGDPAYQAARRFCAMEWDATAYNPVVGGNPGSGCLRWTDGRDDETGADIGTYPGAPDEVHSDGRYWSAMVTCVFNGIEGSLGTAQARNRMLTLVIAHNFDLVPTAANGAFADSIDALRAEDKVRFDGNEITLINACGRQRLGIAPTDPTPPTVDGSLTPAVPDGANGWYRTPPTVNWSVVDPQGALLTKGCEHITLGADTPGTTVTCIGISDGGATVRSLSFKEDHGTPVLAPRLSRRHPRIGQRVRAIPNASDPISGIAVQSCPKARTAKGGRQFVNCSATDNAGNRAVRSLHYTVLLPALKVTKAKVSFAGTVSFRVKAKASVKVKIAARAGKARFRTTSAKLKRGKGKTVRLRPGAKARSALVRKLSGGKSVKVKVKVTFSSGSGTKRTLTLKVRRR